MDDVGAVTGQHGVYRLAMSDIIPQSADTIHDFGAIVSLTTMVESPVDPSSSTTGKVDASKRTGGGTAPREVFRHVAGRILIVLGTATIWITNTRLKPA